jgi:hypothetical protein
MTKLLPCPCCGSKRVFINEHLGRGFIEISCEKCGLTTGQRVGVTIAVGVWNKRPENKESGLRE